MWQRLPRRSGRAASRKGASSTGSSASGSVESRSEQVHNLVAWEQHVRWLEPERVEEAHRSSRCDPLLAERFQELARALRSGRFDTVQVPLNPRERSASGRSCRWPPSSGVAVIVMRPAGRRHARPPLGAAGSARAARGGVLVPGPAEVGALRRARRHRDSGHAQSGHVGENAGAGDPPWFDAEQRRLVETLAV